MKKLIAIVLCCCLMLCVLAACSNQTNNPSLSTSTENPTTSSTSDATTSEDDNSSVPSNTTTTPSTGESSTGASSPEITGPGATESTNPSTVQKPETTTPSATDPIKTDPPATNPPETTPPNTDPPVTDPPVITPTVTAANIIASALSAYNSANEPAPYLKGKAIYQILYGGERAQIGDTLTFNLSIEPANHTDTISVTVTDNLAYSLVGNTLTVSVNSFGDIGSGRITIYACDPNNGAIHTSSKISFAIDAAGNPYDNLAGILSSYIRVLGMSYTSVSEGYTAKDPSLSFTQFEGAPAWDDQILKSESDWIRRCFWLLEKYADSGFTKVNFIETSTSFGFSASN